MAKAHSFHVGFIEVQAFEGEDGQVLLKLKAGRKGRIAKAKMGRMPLPLKFNIRDGQELSFTLEPND